MSQRRPYEYDVGQPGLEEALEAFRATRRDTMYEVPGLGYVVEAKPEMPGYLVNFQADGIGEKGSLHLQRKTYRSAAIDALAMSLNDALLVKSEVTDVVDYVSFPTDDIEPKIKFAMALADECVARGIAVPAGETAIMFSHRGIDPVVTTFGLTSIPEGRSAADVVRDLNRFQEGDVLIGLASSGLHANGYTVLEVFPEAKLEQLATELTRPTEIYYDRIRPLYDRINGMMHITGGGFAKLIKVLPPELDARVEQPSSLQPQPLFHYIKEHLRIDSREMYRRLNNGVGFVLSVPTEESDAVLDELGVGAHVIGSVTRGTGEVSVKSAYDGRDVIFPRR